MLLLTTNRRCLRRRYARSETAVEGGHIRPGLICFNPEFFFFSQCLSKLLHSCFRRRFEQVTTKRNIQSQVDLNKLGVDCFESCCTSTKNLCLEIMDDSFASSNIGNAEGQIIVF